MSKQRSSNPQQHRPRRAPRGRLDRLAVESKLPSVAVELPLQLEIGLEIHHRPVRVGLVGLQERQVADGLDHRAILETVKDPGLAAAVARARRGGGTPQQRVLKRPFNGARRCRHLLGRRAQKPPVQGSHRTDRRGPIFQSDRGERRMNQRSEARAARA